MNISEKIMKLRKTRGLSQEELADMLDVTRQSVSKWESGQSIPDIQKIVQLSQLFGVTTDYLLGDDEDERLPQEAEKPVAVKVRTIRREEAQEFMARAKANGMRYAVATALCIMSPLLLIALNLGRGAEKLGSALTNIIGISVLFVMAAAGVGLFIYSYLKNGTVKKIDADAVVTGEVREEIEGGRRRYVPVLTAAVIAGVTLCILSTIPLIVCSTMFEEYMDIGFIVFDLVVTVAVALFVWAGTRWYAFNRLLGLGEFSRDGRRKAKIAEIVGGIYWPVIVAIYLATSFITGEWGKTWIIWPVAAVLFFVAEAIIEAVLGKTKDDK